MTSLIQMQAEKMAELARQRREATSRPAQPAKLIGKQLQQWYASQLQSWWNSMAPAVRQHPWSMETILASAFPGESPAPRFVSEQLSLAGWTTSRTFR